MMIWLVTDHFMRVKRGEKAQKDWQRWNWCTPQNMNYVNARWTRDYTKPALGPCLAHFAKNTRSALNTSVCAATMHFSSAQADILPSAEPQESPTLRPLYHSWEWSALLTQNINVGVEKRIVGRSQAAPIWPPVTSRSSMLIMEPVNAYNTRLTVLRGREWM